jgi:hypothetical protein
LGNTSSTRPNASISSSSAIGPSPRPVSFQSENLAHLWAYEEERGAS